jgi:small subunit ribosomal protein S6
MRHYEAMYIIDSDVADEDVDSVIEKYSKVVTDGGGVISDASRWERGRRQLAYEINHKREGTYILMQFESDNATPKELDRIFKINDEIVRHLVVRTDEDEE